MRKLLIHPRRKLIIRKGMGLGDFWDLDDLNDDLSFNKTMEMGEDGEGRDDFFERVRGTGAGRATVPDDGWVEVEVDDDADLKTIFTEAKKQKKKENFV